jgi:hypothetical protein
MFEERMMTTITVTPELLKQLKGLAGPLEFRDAEGHFLGAFQPSGEQPTYEQLMATCPYTEDELREIDRQPRDVGRPLSEILEDLQKKWPIE